MKSDLSALGQLPFNLGGARAGRFRAEAIGPQLTAVGSARGDPDSAMSGRSSLRRFWLDQADSQRSEGRLEIAIAIDPVSAVNGAYKLPGSGRQGLEKRASLMSRCEANQSSDFLNRKRLVSKSCFHTSLEHASALPKAGCSNSSKNLTGC